MIQFSDSKCQLAVILIIIFSISCNGEGINNSDIVKERQEVVNQITLQSSTLDYKILRDKNNCEVIRLRLSVSSEEYSGNVVANFVSNAWNYKNKLEFKGKEDKICGFRSYGVIDDINSKSTYTSQPNQIEVTYDSGKVEANFKATNESTGEIIFFNLPISDTHEYFSCSLESIVCVNGFQVEREIKTNREDKTCVDLKEIATDIHCDE